MVRNFKPKKILVPMDFSRQAFNALDTAVAVAQQQDASITLIHAVKDTAIFSGSRCAVFEGAVRYYSRVVNENMNVLCKSVASKYDVRIEYSIEHGIPARTTCEYAKEKNFDLIVIGTKGSFGFWRRFTETTAYKVVRYSPCPVLSVPAHRLFTRFKRIVFPVTDEPRMLEKYDILRPILDTNDVSLLVAGLTEVNNGESVRKVGIAMEVLKDKLRVNHIRYSSQLHFCDSISEMLLEISNSEKPDLMVIIARIEHSLKHFLSGYYSKTIVGRAKCAVLSIRPDMEVLN